MVYYSFAMNTLRCAMVVGLGLSLGSVLPLPHAAAQGAGAAEAAEPNVLRIGDKPPKLEVGAWIRGDAVTDFRTDHVYVVEFWATWCGPCKRSVPHLSELQGKHTGKLTVIGVSIWENRTGESEEQIAKKVRDFVAIQKPAMAYTVASDTGANFMAVNWMGAAGRNSIPHAFIISGGAIGWIGNPLSPDFDQTLDKALEGTLDVKAEAARAAAEEAAAKRYNETMVRCHALNSEGKTSEAVAVIDESLKVETEPNARGSLLRYKFNLLSTYDEPAAYALARSVLEGELKDSENELSMFCEAIAGNDRLKSPDTALAVRLGERANQIAKGKNAAILYRLATAHHRAGDLDKAIATQQSAIDAVKQQMGEEKAAPMVAILSQRLNEWKKSAEK